MKKTEVLREKWLITARRNGEVYRTQFVEFVWVAADSPAGRLEEVGPTKWCPVRITYPGPKLRKVER